MRTGTVIIGLALGAASSLAILAATQPRSSALPFYRSKDMTPEWLAPREADSRLTHRVASFSFTDQHDATVTERAFANKITIVQFFFTECGDICPVTTGNISDLLGRFAGDSAVQVLSYSVTPERDSSSVLRAYAKKRGLTDARWHFLTANRPDMERLARESFFAGLGDGKTYGIASIAHTESLLLIDGDRRVRGVYAGMLKLEIDKLGEDIRQLMREGVR